MKQMIMIKFTKEELENENIRLNDRILSIADTNNIKDYIVIIEIREKNE